MRILSLVFVALLSGCATSLATIRDKSAVEVVTSPRSVQQIEECIRLSQPGERRVDAIDMAGAREVTIWQAEAGMVMHFRLVPTTAGTEVTFRRKGGLVNYDDQARACYGSKG